MRTLYTYCLCCIDVSNHGTKYCVQNDHAGRCPYKTNLRLHLPLLIVNQHLRTCGDMFLQNTLRSYQQHSIYRSDDKRASAFYAKPTQYQLLEHLNRLV